MNRPKTRTNVDQFRHAAKAWLVRAVAASRHRRHGLVIALLLAVPVIAWTPTLGLLFWARLRLLTNLPRTAMATEAPETLALVPIDVFPERMDVGFDEASSRDPLRNSPHDPFNRAQDGSTEPFDANFGAQETDEATWSTSRRRYIDAIVGRLRLQGLITGRSIAIIEGRTYRVGELLEREATEGESITLHAVERDSVVVEVDGMEFRIRLVGGGSGRSSLRHTAGGEFR